MIKDMLTQSPQTISLANAQRTSKAQNNILFCLTIVDIMKAVVLNWKDLVWQATQRWKVSTAMKLLREHLTLIQDKLMKGNFWP